MFYGTPTTLSPRRLNRIIAEAKPQLVYLNSVFSRLAMAYLAARRLQRAKPAVVINPRGELDPGAMSIKPLRKKVYLTAARFLGFFQGSIGMRRRSMNPAISIANAWRGRARSDQLAYAAPRRNRCRPSKSCPDQLGLFSLHASAERRILPFPPRFPEARARARSNLESREKLDPEWPLVERIIDKLPDHVGATYEVPRRMSRSTTFRRRPLLRSPNTRRELRSLDL